VCEGTAEDLESMMTLHVIGVGESARALRIQEAPASGMRTWMSAGKPVRHPREAALSVSRLHDEIRRRSGEEDDGEGKDEAPVNWYVKSVQP
jgi:hypothetical protein